jgi:hypothetical protein
MPETAKGELKQGDAKQNRTPAKEEEFEIFGIMKSRIQDIEKMQLELQSIEETLVTERE